MAEPLSAKTTARGNQVASAGRMLFSRNHSERRSGDYYFFSAGAGSAFFSSLAGAAGVASSFSSSFEAPQPQPSLFTSSVLLEQPQSLFFSSQPQLFSSQPQAGWQQV